MNRSVSVQTTDHWETSAGVEFLLNLGVEPGNRLVDFGSGSGHYSIPAAQVVGDSGIVYAVDKNHDRLEDITAKRRYIGNHRIIPILTDESNSTLPFQSNSIDFVLAYDILHLIDDRTPVYQELRRILKPTGLLSVHPKHTRDDYPLANFAELELNDVRMEIKAHQFRCVDEFTADVSHDGQVIPGTIMNFQKTASK